MHKTTQILAIGVIAAGLSGCGGTNDFTPGQGMQTDEIYAQACAECHGDQGQGKMGFLLSIAGSEESEAEIVEKIRGGGIFMPAFPNIDEPGALELARHIKAL